MKVFSIEEVHEPSSLFPGGTLLKSVLTCTLLTSFILDKVPCKQWTDFLYEGPPKTFPPHRRGISLLTRSLLGNTTHQAFTSNTKILAPSQSNIWKSVYNVNASRVRVLIRLDMWFSSAWFPYKCELTSDPDINMIQYKYPLKVSRLLDFSHWLHQSVSTNNPDICTRVSGNINDIKKNWNVSSVACCWHYIRRSE